MRSIGFFQVDSLSPVLTAVEIFDTATKDFICTFDKPISDILPQASAFTVSGLTVVKVAKTGTQEITVTTNEEASGANEYVLCYNNNS